MSKIAGKSKDGKIRIEGSHFTASRGPGFAIIRTAKKFSEDSDSDRINLKAAQSHRARKAAKPTMPKLPWDGEKP